MPEAAPSLSGADHRITLSEVIRGLFKDRLERSYAQRFNILPVAVSGKRVTIATAEPWIREWEGELARTLCPRCREPTVIEATRWHALTGDEHSEPPAHAFSTKGCDECRHTGYRGRTGVFEILTMDPVIAALVQADAEAAELRRAALAHGMRPLRLSCAAKVAAGVTTFEEVMSVLQLERAPV